MTEPTTKEHLDKLPKTIPAGRVLVHNLVFPPTRRLGMRGFRAWLQAEPGGFAVCGCGWAPELGQHYAHPGYGEAP
jgi:hypothetical protein